MKYEEVYANLIQEFPDFIMDQDDIDLQYVVAGYFVSFLVEKYEKNDTDTLKRGLEFIENLHLSEDAKTRELATIGYLESMQGRDFAKSDKLLSYLGVESKKWWFKLNDFWNGNIYALTYD